MTEPLNLAAVLAQGYAHAADRPALMPPSGEPWTYGDLDARTAAFAGALADLEVGVGDRLITTAGKSIDAVALYLACLRRGVVYIPLNPAFTGDERRFFIDDAEPALMVTDAGEAAMSGTHTETLDGAGGGTLGEAASAADPISEIAATDASDLAAMLYTSGTTGRPKGAMLTHQGLIRNGRALNAIWGFGPGDVLVHGLPIFHVHGLFVALHSAFLSGCQVRFLPKFSVDGVLDALDGATVMMGVPTHYGRLLDDPRFDVASCSTMRLFTSGSAPMTEAMHRRFTERTGHRILERYGMTETGIISSNPLEGDRVPGTVGFALPEMEVRVATDDGVCEPDETGVVEVRGPHLFAGYWQLPDKTAAEFRPDGFFITGDVGALDAEGRLRLEGRAGDMIISGGENVYPKEIELVLDAAPGVVESAVVGAPHPDFGEMVVAWLVCEEDPDLDAVRAAVGDRLARFKHPKRYVVIDELPRNTMGKVQKAELRTRPLPD